MSVFLTTLIGLVVILLVLLGGVLLTPVKLRLYLRSSPKYQFRFEASLFGGTTPYIPIVDSTRRDKRAKKTPKKRKSKTSRKSGRGGGTRLIKNAPRLLGDILGTFHFDYLNLDADFGLPDPADTGHLYGCMTPFLYGAPLPSGVAVSLRPDFNRARFSGVFDAALHITPVALLPPAFRFAWRTFGPKR